MSHPFRLLRAKQSRTQAFSHRTLPGNLLHAGVLLGLLSYASTPSQAQTLKYKVRSDGTILVNKQPFFPFGFQYDVYEPNPSGLTESNRTAAINAISGAGFTYIVTGVATGAGANNFNTGTFYANCDAKSPPLRVIGLSGAGSYYDQGGASDSELQNFINTYKGKASPFGWQLGDDVTGRTNGIGWAQARIVSRQTLAKQLDPNRLTFISSGVRAQDQPGGDVSSASYLGLTDLFGVQSYVLSDYTGNPLGYTQSQYSLGVDQSDAGVAAGRQRTAVLGTIQTFRYKKTDEFPNPARLRNATYAALTGGVKGLLGYTYERSLGPNSSDGSESVQNFPDSWKALAGTAADRSKSLRSEISFLEAVLTDGCLMKNVDTGSQYTKASLWVYRGQVYLIAQNISWQGNNSINVALPGYTTGTLDNVFAYRPAGALSLANGRVMGDVPPASWSAGQDPTTISGGILVRKIALQTLLSNPDFEAGYTGWSTWDVDSHSSDAVQVLSGSAKYGNNFCSHSKATPFYVVSSQTTTGLQNGNYTIRAWVRASDSLEICQMEALSGGNLYTAPISSTYAPEFADSIWVPVVIKNVPVTNGTVQISFKTKGSNGRFLHFDGVELIKQP